MREDQRQLSQIPPVMRLFIKHFLFAIFKEVDRGLAFVHKIFNKNAEVFALVQRVKFFVMFGINQFQMLVRVR